jgi:hypothetical protein
LAAGESIGERSAAVVSKSPLEFVIRRTAGSAKRGDLMVGDRRRPGDTWHACHWII